MAAAVSACVTFLPYQTLTQSSVWGGGSIESSAPYAHMLESKNGNFKRVPLEFPLMKVNLKHRGRLWFKCLSIHHNFVLVVIFLDQFESGGLRERRLVALNVTRQLNSLTH